MQGRPPKPTALKLIQGNPGKRALPAAEPKPESLPVSAEPPAELSPIGKSHWCEYAPKLVRLGCLTNVDLPVFALACEKWAVIQEAETQIKLTGTIVRSPTGYPIQNPWVAIRNRAVEDYCKIVVHFGMTPVARVRLKGTAQGELDFGPQKASGWDDF